METLKTYSKNTDTPIEKMKVYETKAAFNCMLHKKVLKTISNLSKIGDFFAGNTKTRMPLMPKYGLREARRKDGQQMGCYLPQNHLDDMQELQVHHEFLKRTHNLRLRLRQTLSRASPLPFFFQPERRYAPKKSPV